MLNSTILEVIIGLVFLYLIFSLLATFVNEVISTFLKFRSKHLKKAIQNMMNDKDGKGIALFEKFNDHPLIRSYIEKNGKGFPSYLNAKKFAKIIIEISNISEIIDEKVKEDLPDGFLKKIIEEYIKKSKGKVEVKVEDLEKNIEDWFNSVMERTSGWYNRKIKKLTLYTAIIIAIVFNFDTIHVFQRLSKDSKSRTELVMYAENSIDKYAKYVQIDTTIERTDTLLIEKMDSLKNNINSIIYEEIESIEAIAGIGWVLPKSELKEIDTVLYWLLKLSGWIITAMAISLGAPFWFDLLDKVMKIRGTGKQEKLPNG
jgi:predicted  nucleic acid-binding Zn-ribbon protein